MPFPDEITPVRVVPYRATWPADYETLAARLRQAMGAAAVAIDHIGSTSVPGLAAKDCIDVQIQAHTLDPGPLTAAGFRCRPEPWNRSEVSYGVSSAKLVFAPAAGQRTVNVHLRPAGGPGSRYALLFRDYLRADPAARDAWGAFKLRLAASVPDLAGYGQIKAPATEILMMAARRWAAVSRPA
ncbi:GrpB family protein [Micromonosporaceae bacterium Da 78-11]